MPCLFYVLFFVFVLSFLFFFFFFLLIFSTQDACGMTPSPLEWPMKLWWPQAEAMIAFAKAFALTLAPEQLTRLQEVTEWTYAHLVDHHHGEWFGMCVRDGFDGFDAFDGFDGFDGCCKR